MKTSHGQDQVLPYCQESHRCNCGEGAVPNHVIGDQGCQRFMVPSPQPLGNDPDDEISRWIVEGQIITEYTMRYQRGFAQHPCGCWSRWDGSVNSIEA